MPGAELCERVPKRTKGESEQVSLHDGVIFQSPNAIARFAGFCVLHECTKCGSAERLRDAVDVQVQLLRDLAHGGFASESSQRFDDVTMPTIERCSHGMFSLSDKNVTDQIVERKRVL